MRKIKTKFLNSIRFLFKNSFSEKIIIFLIKSNSVVSALGTKLAPNNYQYKKNTQRKFTRYGLNFKVDISDYVGHYLYFGFKDVGYEKLFSYSKDLNTIFDVGANIGFTAIRMASTMGEKGTVHAFEPDAFNYDQLIKNLELNPKLLVKANKFGLAASNQTLKLEIVTKDNLGGNRISNSATSNYSEIHVMPMDQYCSENKIQKVDLIKIDVEGFELEVLKGAKNTIEKSRPILFVEIDENNLKYQSSTPTELIAFLESYYSKIINSQTGKSISSKDNFNKCHFDLIAYN